MLAASLPPSGQWRRQLLAMTELPCSIRSLTAHDICARQDGLQHGTRASTGQGEAPRNEGGGGAHDHGQWRRRGAFCALSTLSPPHVHAAAADVARVGSIARACAHAFVPACSPFCCRRCHRLAYRHRAAPLLPPPPAPTYRAAPRASCEMATPSLLRCSAALCCSCLRIAAAAAASNACATLRASCEMAARSLCCSAALRHGAPNTRPKVGLLTCPLCSQTITTAWQLSPELKADGHDLVTDSKAHTQPRTLTLADVLCRVARILRGSVASL